MRGVDWIRGHYPRISGRIKGCHKKSPIREDGASFCYTGSGLFTQTANCLRCKVFMPKALAEIKALTLFIGQAAHKVAS